MEILNFNLQFTLSNLQFPMERKRQMRYGIFSDVHSNLEALKVVLDFIQNEKVDNFICLGDIVGYGANPNECIELLRGFNPLIVAGNHDFAVVNLIDFNYFTSWAKEAVFWTQKNITRENESFLRFLTLRVDYSNFTFVHASPYFPEKWIYVLTFNDVLKCFPSFNGWICFIGHSHVPFIFELDGDCRGRVISFEVGQRILLARNKRYVINVGSVGQPRDRDKRSSFAIFDTEANTIVMERISYNYRLTQEKIISAGLPKFLAERLEEGR